ncbi:Glucoamylase, intracellular sporulation-specific [Coemansia sp. RSA 1646]|nr:Glucoamylase, intracellular sporulation-specific [Coemansia sp. RSA 1646]KAJ2085909.1 hypothetical protein IW138_006045 [Coemansia sp. RSA 986]
MKHTLLSNLGAAILLFASSADGKQHVFHEPKSQLVKWIEQQSHIAQQRILANIAPFANDPTALAGAVCASPSRSNPDYYYSWTRDSALTMSEIIKWLPLTSNTTYIKQLEHVVEDYIQFTEHVQQMDTQYGLGEAKYHMDGSAFTESWCNAQPDGPAARALSLIEYARYKQATNGDIAYLVPLIKRDLDYVARVWHQNTHCDVWEESRGLHFYTLAMQRRALHQGAQLLDSSDAYIAAASRIALQLPRFWDARRGYVVATLEHSGGIQSKESQLDAQVLLAALHGDTLGLGIGSREMLATVGALVSRFEPLYAVNRVRATNINGAVVPIGAAVGRYPEDVYNGAGTSRGNPWSLVTSSVAEYHYRLALLYVGAAGAVQGDMARYLLATGDLYMARVARHTAEDGTMHEQWTAQTGFGRGAVDLTWSYVAHTSAARARAQLVAVLLGSASR